MKEISSQKTWVKRIIALYVLRLLDSGPAHGNRMAEEMKKRSEGMMIPNPNAFYPLLRLLEERGYVISEWERPDRRSKRIYQITKDGREVLPLLTAKVKEQIDEMEKTIQVLRKDLF